jgi:hypothetical protein
VAERTVVPLGGRCAVGGLRWLVAAEPVPTADDVATS